jgi:hypothetical protein
MVAGAFASLLWGSLHLMRLRQSAAEAVPKVVQAMVDDQVAIGTKAIAVSIAVPTALLLVSLALRVIRRPAPIAKGRFKRE